MIAGAEVGERVWRMPLGEPALDARELACLEAWVEEVAARTVDRVPPLVDGGMSALDAGRDAGVTDGGVTDADVTDAGVTDADAAEGDGG